MQDPLADAPHLVTINGGSSSIKFAVFRMGTTLERRLSGSVERIGSDRATFTFSSPGSVPGITIEITAGTSAVDFLVNWLGSQPAFSSVRAVGHRVVHGMRHPFSATVTPALLAELRNLQPFDPEHLPLEIELIEAFARQHPQLPQIACFDTAFHRDMPRVAKQLALPRRFEPLGLQRYGFHGLSYTYLVEELARRKDPAVSTGRIILAHLGNGASMAAVLNGNSIDTSMGLTPASGLMMGTRSGDIDPGLPGFLARTGGLSTKQQDHLLNHESGLLGVSQISADVRDLLAVESTDSRAAEALALFCYQMKKCIGSYAAALGGLDTLAFTGGIGQHAPVIRERICADLEFLGIHIDATRNAVNAALISPEGAKVRVHVIATDEELIIARACAVLAR